MIPVPRATYYFKCRTALNSLKNILFNKHLKKDETNFAIEFASFIGSKETVLTSHARIALWTILNSLKLNEGSEVLMTPINLPDMVNMILLNNCKPRFVDFEKQSLNVDIDDLKSKINAKTKVLFVTILNGISINLDPILKMAKENGLITVFDLTQAMGMVHGKNKIAALADYSIFSLCDLKDVHTHRGGVIAFNDISKKDSLLSSLKKIETTPSKKYFFDFVIEDLISTLMLKRIFFQIFIYPVIRILLFLNLIDSLEDITKGKGVKIFNINIGRGFWGGDGDLVRTNLPAHLTYHYTEMQAKIGLHQLKKVHSIQYARIQNAKKLLSLIENKDIIFYGQEDSLFWKFPIWQNEKQKLELKTYLIENGVDCAPSNLPLLSELDVFKKYHNDLTPNARDYTESTINLPAHYYLSEKEIEQMGAILNRFFH
jgi:perosamine synthetase